MNQKNSKYHNRIEDLERKHKNELDAQYGKLPPQAIEEEEAVLGAVMLERDAIYKVLPIIQADAFYKEEHQKIFNVVQELSAESKNIDLVTVTRRLKDKNIIDEVGGPGMITNLTRRVASAAHIEQHARIIADKYLQREIIRRFSNLVAKAYEDNIDELEMLYSVETLAIDALLAGNTGMMHIREVLIKTIRKLDERQEKAKQGEIPGVTTGLADLNRINHGWQPGNLIVIAARPAMGKTALGINLFAKRAAERGKNVCIFSLEMENIELSQRLILSYGGIDRDNFESGRMTEGDTAAVNRATTELERLPIYIDDTPGTNVRYINAVVRNKTRKGECDMVIIDYLQLIESPETWGNKNREREVAEISRGLKKVAKENGVPVILLAQLNRGVENREDKTPRMADIRESGAIEQDADIIIFPWRPMVYGIEQTDTGDSLINVMYLEVAKYRNGRTGTLVCKHNDDLTEFYDYDTHGYAERAEQQSGNAF